MDLTSRAMRLAEDSATAVESLRAKLPLRKIYSGEEAQNKTSFGHIKLNAPSAVIAVFAGGECALEFDGKTVASGASPIIGVIPAGSGELKLSEVKSGATALII